MDCVRTALETHILLPRSLRYHDHHEALVNGSHPRLAILEILTSRTHALSPQPHSLSPVAENRVLYLSTLKAGREGFARQLHEPRGA